MCLYPFARFPSCGIFTPTRTSPVKQQVETTVSRRRWNLQNDKLRVAGHGPGNTRTRRTNTAKRAPNMPMHHHHCSFVLTRSRIYAIHTFMVKKYLKKISHWIDLNLNSCLYQVHYLYLSSEQRSKSLISLLYKLLLLQTTTLLQHIWTTMNINQLMP